MYLFNVESWTVVLNEAGLDTFTNVPMFRKHLISVFSTRFSEISASYTNVQTSRELRCSRGRFDACMPLGFCHNFLRVLDFGTSRYMKFYNF